MHLADSWTYGVYGGGVVRCQTSRCPEADTRPRGRRQNRSAGRLRLDVNFDFDPLPADQRGQSAQQIDEALVTLFEAPNSYTGEEVVEIAAHGSPVVLGFLLARAVELLLSGKKNRLVVKKNGVISDIAIEKAMKSTKKIDMSFYRMAKELSS